MYATPPRSPALMAWVAAVAVVALAGSCRAANFVVERSTVRVKAPSFAATFASAIGDVRLICMACATSRAASRHLQTARPAVLPLYCALLCPVLSAAPDPQFGIPSYGAMLVGSAAFLPANAQGCSDVVSKLPASADILLVDRGGCFFVEKAWHAQQAGARAVVVTDNVQEQLLTMAVPEDRPELAALVAKISIPTVLITKEAGDQIKALLARPDAAQVTVELDWSESIQHPDNRVEWELW